MGLLTQSGKLKSGVKFKSKTKDLRQTGLHMQVCKRTPLNAPLLKYMNQQSALKPKVLEISLKIFHENCELTNRMINLNDAGFKHFRWTGRNKRTWCPNIQKEQKKIGSSKTNNFKVYIVISL